MILPGSYANGFAPRDGMPLYPELWRGCVGAWNPGLGPTGLTLRDWSGYGVGGTLTNGPVFGQVGGVQCITYDGSNDYTTLGNHPLMQFNFGTPFSIAARVKTSITTGGIVGKRATIGWYFSISGGGVQLVLQGTGATAIIVESASTTAGNGEWHHVAATYNANASATGMRIFIDGKPVATTTVLNTNAGSCINALPVLIGSIGTAAFPLAASITDLVVWNRVVPDATFATLSLRPGIAYELAPRRRSSSAAAAFNRRRRLLLGATS